MAKMNAKEQAGKKLLAAIDAYIDAVLAEQAEKKISVRNEKIRKSSEEFRERLLSPPESKPGPYEQSLRESIKHS